MGEAWDHRPCGLYLRDLENGVLVSQVLKESILKGQLNQLGFGVEA